MSAEGVHVLDQYFADILAGVSPAGRARTARTVGKMLRISQQQRIRAQRNPDGASTLRVAAKNYERNRGSPSSGKGSCDV